MSQPPAPGGNGNGLNGGGGGLPDLGMVPPALLAAMMTAGQQGADPMAMIAAWAQMQAAAGQLPLQQLQQAMLPAMQQPVLQQLPAHQQQPPMQSLQQPLQTQPPPPQPVQPQAVVQQPPQPVVQAPPPPPPPQPAAPLPPGAAFFPPPVSSSSSSAASVGSGSGAPIDSPMTPATPASTAAKLLSLDETEERILHLLTLASTVTASLSEVHPDGVRDECASAARDFFATLRLVYASLIAQIRAHASELHPMGAAAAVVAPAAGAHSGAVAAAQAASLAAAAHEYRRNVYLDTQSMAVALESLDIHKERILELQQQQRSSNAPTLKQEQL